MNVEKLVRDEEDSKQPFSPQSHHHMSVVKESGQTLASWLS